MSTKQIFRLGLLATAGAATLAFTANAQSRYGGVYEYESGQNCGQACVPAQAGRYGTTAPAPAAPPVYVDCSAMGTCAPAPAYAPAQPMTVYTQPAPVYTQSYAQTAPVTCPAGTTAQPDGSCLQASTSYSTGSYSSGSSYSSTYSTGTTMADCPAGTTAQPDGTCMQTSGSSYSSSSTYSAPSTSYSTDSYTSGYSSGATMADCPAGTTAQPDGTCMQGGSGSYAAPAADASIYAGSGVELYQGDATVSQPAPSYGYRSDGSYGASDYLPVRK